MFSPDQWAASTGVAFYNGVATQSVRLDDGSSAYLNRTPSSAGNRQTWTISFWIKRSTISTNQGLWSTYNGTGTINTQSSFRASDDKLDFYDNDGSYQWNLVTTQVFRDTSAWYHLVYAVDTTQATASDRVKLYVNGTQITAFDTETYPSLNFSGADWNNNVIQFIGKHSSNYFDGYIAEFNNIDGQQLDPTSFGETKNGVWIPKAYTGSYGTNGFRLQFNQTGTGTASSSTIGADTSGNNNHWTSSGITASDCDMPDSPENNFATINPLARSRFDNTGTISEGNLKYNALSADRGFGFSSMGVASGKWYWELRVTATGRFQIGVGYESVLAFNGTYFGNNPSKAFAILDFNGNLYYDGTNTAYGSSLSVGDVVMVALDMDNYLCWFGKNGTWFDSATQSEIENSTATNDATTQMGTQQNLNNGDEVFPFMTCQETAQTGGGVFNFGQDSTFAGGTTAGGNTDGNGIGDFKYSVPSGYLALCTSNLPEPTISPNETTQADDYFNTVIYNGNNDATRTFDVGFVSDFAWFKARNQNGYGHQSYDSVRGVQKRLRSNDSTIEATNSEGVLDFDDNGLLKIGTDAFLNESGTTMVIWNWKAGGTAVLNEQGSIDSNVSANTDAGFSIATWSGNETSGATIGHGLNSAPEMIITKCRSHASSWVVGIGNVAGFSTNDYLTLNSTNTKGSSSTFYQGYGATTFTVGVSAADEMNRLISSTARTYVSYCFHSVKGYSKISSFTGNADASGDGTFVYTGFRPAFVMFKNVDTVTAWIMQDAVRDSFNVATQALVANEGYSEATVSARNIDFLSNGFKLRTTAVDTNGTQTLIYMAFAENPFKYANAR